MLHKRQEQAHSKRWAKCCGKQIPLCQRKRSSCVQLIAFLAFLLISVRSDAGSVRLYSWLCYDKEEVRDTRQREA